MRTANAKSAHSSHSTECALLESASALRIPRPRWPWRASLASAGRRRLRV